MKVYVLRRVSKYDVPYQNGVGGTKCFITDMKNIPKDSLPYVVRIPKWRKSL